MVRSRPRLQTRRAERIDGPFRELLNRMREYVASRTLRELFADIASVNTAIACWAWMDEAPDLAWHAAHHLGVPRSRRLRRRTR
jgi:hypothetical protein